MVVARAGRQFDDAFGRRTDAGLSGAVRHAHERVGVGDVERVAQQRHAVRRMQTRHEHAARFRDAIAITVTQQRDAIGARHACAGAFQDDPHKPIAQTPLLVGAIRGCVGLQQRAHRRWAARKASADAASPARTRRLGSRLRLSAFRRRTTLGAGAMCISGNRLRMGFRQCRSGPEAGFARQIGSAVTGDEHGKSGR